MAESKALDMRDQGREHCFAGNRVAGASKWLTLLAAATIGLACTSQPPGAKASAGPGATSSDTSCSVGQRPEFADPAARLCPRAADGANLAAS
jgi:hypothetical protein